MKVHDVLRTSAESPLCSSRPMQQVRSPCAQSPLSPPIRLRVAVSCTRREQGKERAEEREREASAQSVRVREGKVRALQTGGHHGWTLRVPSHPSIGR